MTLDTTDLRTVFAEHAATLTHVPDFATAAAAQGRRTQRRRTAAGVGGIAVVVAGILGLTQLTGDGTEPQSPPHRRVSLPTRKA